MPENENTTLNDRSESAVHVLQHPKRRILALARVLAGYALAAVLCGTILLIRLGIGYAPGDPPMLVLYMIPVIASAYVGGFGPGIFCTALGGLLASYYLLVPVGFLLPGNTDGMLNLGTMLLTGAIISLMVESLHRMRRNSEESEERYRVVADNTYDWEFWIDSNGDSIYQSPSCKRVTGYDASFFIANPAHLKQIVHPDDLERFTSHRHGVVSDQTQGDLQFRIIRADGEIRWIEHFCLPVFGKDGTFLGTRGSNSDITERKQMEEAMLHSEKMASVGRLAAGMAHELNNPLGGILQSLQNVRRRISLDLPANTHAAEEHGCSVEAVRQYLTDRQVFDFLDAIEDSGHRAARIVGNMLEFSRKTASGKILADVNEIAEAAIRHCSTKDELLIEPRCRDVPIIRDFDPAILKVSCIPSQLEQVFINLLQNAAQSMSGTNRTGSPGRIILKTKGDANAVYITVEDNGPGMEQAILKKAFDPFFTTQPVGKGTGLGLSIAYFVVTNNHGGTITVDSAPGEGTRFTIRLPLGHAQD